MARRDHLVMSQVGDEVLVYDETTHAIHRLNPTSHLVWSTCDGTRTLPAIRQVAREAIGAEVSEDVVRLALGQLAAAELLDGTLPAEMREPGQSRRVMLRRLAIAGGVALPVLVSVSAPTAAVAGFSLCTPTHDICVSGVPCCAGPCDGNICQPRVSGN
jgi:hypothetical protein